MSNELGFDQIQELVRMVEGSSLEEFSLEVGDLKLQLRKPAPAVRVAEPAARPQAPAPITAALQPSVPASSTPQATAPAPEAHGNLIRSPMVGTFYRAPGPDASPFVEIGSRVEAGQTVCIIEAMKLMNEIEAETGGVVRRILVENGAVVEFGQPLIELE